MKEYVKITDQGSTFFNHVGYIVGFVSKGRDTNVIISIKSKYQLCEINIYDVVLIGEIEYENHRNCKGCGKHFEGWSGQEYCYLCVPSKKQVEKILDKYESGIKL